MQTDHDLTGQIVWPACVFLSWFVYTHQDLFRDRVVLELGAGCGLGGFVSAHYARSAFITDGNEVRLLRWTCPQRRRLSASTFCLRPVSCIERRASC